MSRSKWIPSAMLAMALVSSEAMAGSTGDAASSATYLDYADVVGVMPIVTIVQVQTPSRECWEEPVTRRRARHADYRSYTPVIVGGIIGGVVGNQFGSGSGKKLMTAAGAVLGGSIGRDVSRHHRRHYPHPTTETHCRVRYDTHEEERVDGYRVEYSYRGRTYVRRMGHNPGDRLRVRVRVDPAD